MIGLIVTINIKPEHKAAFMASLEGDGRGSNNDEPGCLQFDVHADPNDENIVYLYEVYVDRAAWETAHRAAPHYTKWRETVSPWFDGDPTRVELAPIFTKDKGKV